MIVLFYVLMFGGVGQRGRKVLLAVEVLTGTHEQGKGK